MLSRGFRVIKAAGGIVFIRLLVSVGARIARPHFKPLAPLWVPTAAILTTRTRNARPYRNTGCTGHAKSVTRGFYTLPPPSGVTKTKNPPAGGRFVLAFAICRRVICRPATAPPGSPRGIPAYRAGRTRRRGSGFLRRAGTGPPRWSQCIPSRAGSSRRTG